MGKIRVVCPQCKMGLNFKEEPGYQNRLLECIGCHFKAKVSVYMQGNRPKPSSVDDTGDTVLGQNFVGNSCDIGHLRVLADNRCFRLKMGANIVGRASQSKPADIAIPSDDLFMSRHHVKINVVKVRGNIEHHLEEIGSKNIAVLNGKNIVRNDILKLKFGDILTLGKTDIVLESDEDTVKAFH